MVSRRRKTRLGAINPTKQHEDLLRSLINQVIRHYEAGRPDLIDAYLSAARLGRPAPIQTVINELRNDVRLPRSEAIGRLAEWAESVGRWHGRKWQARVMAAVNIDVTPLTRSETIGPALREAISESTRLIRDIGDQTADRLERAALEAFENGEGKAGLAKRLRDEFGYARRRANLIAEDQLGKLTGKLDELRQSEAGIDSYQWLTVGDGRVRPTHAARNGDEFRWSDPPIGGHPGTEIRCRCRARAVIPGMNRWGEG
ncbi:MAG: minor capsid protein [Acidobacteria bacterium]|nr:minor capsid protein [Acidobacteriota bacterium]